MTEIMPPLRLIKYCAFSPSINNIEAVNHLDKLNVDLITLLEEYFKSNISCSAWMHCNRKTANFLIWSTEKYLTAVSYKCIFCSQDAKLGVPMCPYNVNSVDLLCFIY